MNRLLSIFLVVITLVSCDDINEKVLPDSTGKAGDLLIVADTAYYNHKTGYSIKKIFAQPQVALPQNEPLFNIIHLPHRSFARIFQTNRNIIIVDVDMDNKPSISVNENVWSNNQLVINITAPNDKTAAEIIEKNSNNLLYYFEDAETDRLQQQIKANRTSKMAKKLEQKIGINIPLSDNFILAKEEKDFIWFRKEKMVGQHPVSQGIFVYTYPYDNDSIFETTKLVEKRNEFTKRYLKGGQEGSYMESYPEYTPNAKEINLKNNYVKELRGLWRIKGDFMGGPYISYSLVDQKNNRVINIDGYVYAPKFDKREYLRELEALAKSVTF